MVGNKGFCLGTESVGSFRVQQLDKQKNPFFFYGHMHHTFNCLLFLRLSRDRESGVENSGAFFFQTKKKTFS